MKAKTLLFLYLLMTALSFLSIVSPVEAATHKGKWLDFSTIELDKHKYYDEGDPGDSYYKYSDDCGESEIENISDDGKSAALQGDIATDSPTQPCNKDIDDPVELSDVDKRLNFLVWVKPDVIATSFKDGRTKYTDKRAAPNGKRDFIADQDTECRNSIWANPEDKTSTWIIRSNNFHREDDEYDLAGSGSNKNPEETAKAYEKEFLDGGTSPKLSFSNLKYDIMDDDGDCGQVKVSGIPLGRPENSNSDPGDDSTLGDNYKGEDTTSNTDTQCDSGTVFTWAVCGMINFALDTMDWIQKSVIEPFLTVSPLTTNNPSFAVWKGIRTLANLTLVPIFLVIIYSAAINNRS